LAKMRADVPYPQYPQTDRAAGKANIRRGSNMLRDRRPKTYHHRLALERLLTIRGMGCSSAEAKPYTG
jgi:hypothetical protein